MSTFRRPLLEQDNGTSSTSAGFVSSFFNLLKSMIGTGLLTLPWATAQVGIVLSAVGLLFLAWLSQLAIRLTVLCDVAISTETRERNALIESMVCTPCPEAEVSSALSAEASPMHAELADDVDRPDSPPSYLREAPLVDVTSAPMDVEKTGHARHHLHLHPSSSGLSNTASEKPSASPAGSLDSHGHGRIALATYGRSGQLITVASLLVAQLGVSASYVDFIANKALKKHTGLPLGACYLLLWGLLSVTSTLRNLKAVSFLSLAALLVYCYVICLLVYTGTRLLEGFPLASSDIGGGSLALPPPPFHPSMPQSPPAAPPPSPLYLAVPAKLGDWFGPSVFAFEGMGTALSIYEAMELQDPRPFFNVVSSAYVVTFFLYVGLASFVYSAWGDGIAKVVIDDLPEMSSLTSEIALSVILALSFVLQMTPVFHVVERVVHQPRMLPHWAWPVTRSSVVAFVALVGYTVPDMETMVNLTGSVAFSAIGFVLPGLFYLKLRPESKPPSRNRMSTLVNVAASWAMVVTGIVGAVWGVISAVPR